MDSQELDHSLIPSPPSDQDRPRRRLRACSNRWLGKHCRALQTSFVTVSPQACALTQTVCLKSGVFLLLLLTLGIEITMKKVLWIFIRENIILESSLEKTWLPKQTFIRWERSLCKKTLQTFLICVLEEKEDMPSFKGVSTAISSYQQDNL